MNHPSEWARFFDENTGSYRYKHKGSGVIRDTLMTIGKVFKSNVKNVAKKTAEKATKTIAEKAGELAVEKGSKQIRKYCKSESKNRCLRMQERNLKIFCKTKNQKIRRRSCEIKPNFGKRNLMKKNFFFYLYKLLSTCSELNRTSKNLNIFKSI